MANRRHHITLRGRKDTLTIVLRAKPIRSFRTLILRSSRSALALTLVACSRRSCARSTSWKRLGLRLRKARVERSLYQRAVGYNYEAVKIFMPANRSQPVYAKYIEHVPPDVTAGIYWTKNRMPERWRDQQQIDHVLGKYIISDKPMSPEDWARERADVLDAEPQFGEGREEDHKAHADKLLVKK
jgi:hypothetical protein